MKISLIASGTKMPDWVTIAYREYTKRLPPDFAVRLIEIPAGKRGKGADISRLEPFNASPLSSIICPASH